MKPSPFESSASVVLSIDQGGQSSRVLAFDRHGRERASGRTAVSERRPHESWVEQEPAELVASIRTSLSACVENLGPSSARLVAAGLATQRSSLVCWDRESGMPLSPVLSWQDRRASDWLQRFAPRADEIHARTGLFLSPHYGASKMRWCLDHLPEVDRALSAGRLAIGPLASYLAFALLDEHPFVVDPANASRTLLWNVHTGEWDEQLLDLFGVPRAVLPRVVPTRHAYGTLRVDGRSVPLQVVTGDQSAAIFAAGQPQTDVVYANLGTGAFVQRPVDGAAPELARLLASVACSAEGRTTYVVEGTINGAGSALRWIEAELRLDAVESKLDTWMSETPEPPLFLNGVSGLAAPFWVPDFPSRFVGEGDAHAKVVAVAESIVFLVQAILDEMATKLSKPRALVVSGGLSASNGICERIASLSGLDVHRSQETEATAKGLARLLWREDMDGGEKPSAPVEPTVNASLLRKRYVAWRSWMPPVARA
ncbi:MAG: FGGY family carbohydrate kinase [Planctomycetota bacterium]